jgi:hypothetical protein
MQQEKELDEEEQIYKDLIRLNSLIDGDNSKCSRNSSSFRCN